MIFDVVVWSVPSVRSDLFAIKRMPIDTAGGGYVPLEAVADVALAPTPNEITREGGSRRIDVTTNVRDRDLGAVADDIQAALTNVQFPAGYHAEVLGEYAAREESQNRLLAARPAVAARDPAGAARRLRLGAPRLAGRA